MTTLIAMMALVAAGVHAEEYKIDGAIKIDATLDATTINTGVT